MTPLHYFNQRETIQGVVVHFLPRWVSIQAANLCVLTLFYTTNLLATEMLHVGGFNVLTIKKEKKKKSTWQTRLGYRKFRGPYHFVNQQGLTKQKGVWLLSLSWFYKGLLTHPFPLIPLHFSSFYFFTSIRPVQILPLWNPVSIDWLRVWANRLATKTSSTKSMPLKEKLNLFRVPQSFVI